MNQNSKMAITAGVLISIGVVLPIAFHAVGMAGAIFLPMHISVLIGGYLLSPLFALFVGMLTPILSSFLTGMPPAYLILPIMVVELGIYALVISMIRRKMNLNVYASLITAMVIGRMGAGMAVAVMVTGFGLKMNPAMYLQGAVLNGLPGIAIQLVFIPALIKAIRMSGFMSEHKYT